MEHGKETLLPLLGVSRDGLERSEVHDGFHWCALPMPNEDAAVRRFAALSHEPQCWGGERARQAGRRVLVLGRAPNFDSWWHAAKIGLKTRCC